MTSYSASGPTAKRSYRLLAAGLIALAVLLSGCRPKGILHSWEMRSVLVDLHKTDALLQIKGLVGYNNAEERTYYYAQVMEKHGITQAEFDSSLVWYTAHPSLFDKIYPKVLAELKAEEDQFVALHAAELEPKKIEDKDEPKKEKLRMFSPEQVDSIFWTIQNGYASPWHPMPEYGLMHDSVEEFLPQIAIFRGWVIDSFQTSVSVP